MTGVQLWDSDQSAADGGLGFIDITLNEVMQSPRTNGKMSDRRDKLPDIGTDGGMACTLDWSLGYFPKTGVPPTQLVPQIDDLKNMVAEEATKKLREARKDEPHEIEQRKAEAEGLKVNKSSAGADSLN